MRKASFALHIRPLFTETDVAHMQKGGLDLSSYDDVKSHANSILTRLKGGPGISQMPPASTTGPWPDEWVALFQRWVSEGCAK
jgi:hypothetical protein